MKGADLSFCDLTGAVIDSPVQMSGANLHGANLSRINSRNEYEVTFDRDTRMTDCVGLFGPDKGPWVDQCTLVDDQYVVFGRRFRDSLSGWPRLLNLADLLPESLLRWQWDSLFKWSTLRIGKTIYLFRFSGWGFAALVLYVAAIRWYNQGVCELHKWAAASEDAGWANSVRSIPAPTHLLWQLSAMFSLVIAALLFSRYCPGLVREYAEDKWTHELKKTFIEYRAADYSRLWIRTLCAAFFGYGAGFTLWWTLNRTIPVVKYLLTGA